MFRFSYFCIFHTSGFGGQLCHPTEENRVPQFHFADSAASPAIDVDWQFACSSYIKNEVPHSQFCLNGNHVRNTRRRPECCVRSLVGWLVGVV